MSFIESLYESDRIFDGFKRNQNFGISPRPVNAIIFNGVNSLKAYFTVNQTIIENSSWCEVKGVLVRIKMGSAPVDIYDGDFVGDYTGADLTSHAIGSNNPIIINGLTNFSTYYVRFFPYSDHGIYNLSSTHTASVIPTDTMVYGFHQNFLDLNPDTSITYLLDAIGFTPIQANITTAAASNGSWPMWDWLQENLPYMVRKTGIKDYALDPNDYTKKLDGSASDISNASYDGGAFAWLPKLYMKEVYAADGNSRDVYFARSNTGLYTSDFYPVGFVDPSNQVMEGVWLPMFYMGSENLSLNNTTIYKTSLNAFNSYINDFSIRGRFLGGPLMNLLRDVMYMLFKSTNIQKYAGYGWSGWSGTFYDVINNPIKNKLFPFAGIGRDPNQGRFNGSGIGFDESGTVTGYQFDKAFHSNVFSYAYGLLDPYLGIYKDDIISRVYILTNYNMSPFGDFTNYQLLSYSPSTGSSNFRTKLIKLDTKFGSIPDGTSPIGSNITGLCDYSGPFRGGSSGSTTYCSRLMYNNYGKTTGCPGIGNIHDGVAYGSSDDYRSAAILLLPEIGYSPT